jgi:hypothetical protein
LVGIGFTARGGTRTDDSDPVCIGISVSDKQEALLSRHPERDEPALMLRVVRVNVSAGGSKYTVFASSNETPCLRSFAAAFSGSHS